MRIDTQKLRAFFRRTGKLEQVSWSENINVPIKKTIQPDERLNYTETFKHIRNERQS